MSAAVRDSAAAAARRETVLQVRDLHVTFASEAGPVRAVRGVSYDLEPGRTLGIVGESGCGKSVTALAVMGLLPDTARVAGSVQLKGRELVGLGDDALSEVRGRHIGMVFQDPLSALTPVLNIGQQLAEGLDAHQSLSRLAVRTRSIELLDLVGLPDPAARLKAYPHELSGGMRQRVMIAIAIANRPDVIIADESTTALDVTIQAQVLDALRAAQRETGAAVVLITHDLGVVAGLADDVLVMYAGRPVEYGSVDDVFYRPGMPYTMGLLAAVPRPDLGKSRRLVPIDGNPPSLVDLPPGCPFAARCPLVQDRCLEREPPLVAHTATQTHRVACVYARRDRESRARVFRRVPGARGLAVRLRGRAARRAQARARSRESKAALSTLGGRASAPQDRHDQSRRRRELRHSRRRDARARRRIRLRQEHDAARDHETRSAGRGADHDSRPRRRATHEPRGADADSQRPADRLSGSVGFARSSDAGLRHPRGALDDPTLGTGRDQSPDRRDHAARRPESGSYRPFSGAVLGRSTATHRDRARVGRRAQAHRARRAGVVARRFDPSGRDRLARRLAVQARTCRTCSSRTICPSCATSPTASQ